MSAVVRSVALVALVGVLSACGSSAHTRAAAQKPSCASHAQWQRLATRIHADVYCPAWLPNPLSPSLSGSSHAGTYVERDRSYLVLFLEMDVVGSENSEVHVNLRGYPGRTAIPVCEDTVTAGKKVLRPKLPCFADTYGHKRVAGNAITIYTANQGADKWHVAYVWRHRGGLYVASQHVTPPYSFTKVLQNLDRVVRSLVLVPPAGANNSPAA
jgi:hypothetical protein